MVELVIEIVASSSTLRNTVSGLFIMIFCSYIHFSSLESVHIL